MSLHYVLDGYNIIKRSDFSARKILKDSRCDLARFIATKKPCGSPKNKVTIVFDGVNDLNNPPLLKEKEIEIIFTRQQSADSLIKKMVESSPNPKRMVVVSDDKEIQFFVKSCAGRCMSVAEFMEKGNPSPRITSDSPKIELSYQEAAKINKELARVWLKPG